MPANLAGALQAAGLGLWPGTAPPAEDPGAAPAAATLRSGTAPPGTLRGAGGGAGPRGRPWVPRPHCGRLRVALDMAWPAVPGDQVEKLRAGWELGRKRDPLSVPTRQRGTQM